MPDVAEQLRQLDALYETEFYRQSLVPDTSCRVDFAKEFFGTGWGVLEVNRHGQWWRWLGPFLQSHLYFVLVPGHDYLLKTHIHTAASADILNALRVKTNNCPVIGQGLSFEDEHYCHYALLSGKALAAHAGKLRVTYEITAMQSSSSEKGSPRSIAFSHAVCEKYSELATLIPIEVGKPGLKGYASRALRPYPSLHGIAKRAYNSILKK